MRWDAEGGGPGGREHEAAFASFATSRISQQEAKVCMKVFAEGGGRCLLGLAAKCAILEQIRGHGLLPWFRLAFHGQCIPE